MNYIGIVQYLDSDKLTEVIDLSCLKILMYSPLPTVSIYKFNEILEAKSPNQGIQLNS